MDIQYVWIAFDNISYDYLFMHVSVNDYINLDGIKWFMSSKDLNKFLNIT